MFVSVDLRGRGLGGQIGKPGRGSAPWTCDAGVTSSGESVVYVKVQDYVTQSGRRPGCRDEACRR